MGTFHAVRRILRSFQFCYFYIYISLFFLFLVISILVMCNVILWEIFLGESILNEHTFVKITTLLKSKFLGMNFDHMHANSITIFTVSPSSNIVSLIPVVSFSSVAVRFCPVQSFSEEKRSFKQCFGDRFYANYITWYHRF